MTITPALITAATREWNRWGGSIRPLHGHARIVGTENAPPYVGYVNDYWKIVGKPTWNGNTPQPWSAAFISYCFNTAGAGEGFPYKTGHVDYCRAILEVPGKYPGLALSDPMTTALQASDLLWSARGGGDCPKPPKSYAEAIAALRAGIWFCSHCDIVVETSGKDVDVIGGNVSNSVTKTTYATSHGHISDPRHDWLAVIKNTI